MSETTLLDIQSDYIFKRVFGVEKKQEAPDFAYKFDFKR